MKDSHLVVLAVGGLVTLKILFGDQVSQLPDLVLWMPAAFIIALFAFFVIPQFIKSGREAEERKKRARGKLARKNKDNQD